MILSDISFGHPLMDIDSALLIRDYSWESTVSIASEENKYNN